MTRQIDCHSRLAEVLSIVRRQCTSGSISSGFERIIAEWDDILVDNPKVGEFFVVFAVYVMGKNMISLKDLISIVKKQTRADILRKNVGGILSNLRKTSEDESFTALVIDSNINLLSVFQKSKKEDIEAFLKEYNLDQEKCWKL